MIIVAEVFKLPSGSLIPQLYSVSESGDLVRSVTDTLLDLISESLPDQLEKLKDILISVQKGTYKRRDTSLADWGINDKFVWIDLPLAEVGFVLISNENIPDFSMDDGTPQKFSIEQLLGAIAHWVSFKKILYESGMEGLVGKKFDCKI